MSNKRKVKRWIRRILYIIVILTVVIGLFLWPSKAQLWQDYNIAYPQEWRDVSAADWMAHTDGSQKLTSLSIPGSHDSATRYVLLPLVGRCQEVGLAEQMNMGVRFLDIRVQTKKQADGTTKLLISHGVLPCKTEDSLFAAQMTMEKTLRTCKSFLKKHPGEAVLLCLKHENGNATNEELETALGEYRKALGTEWCEFDGSQTLDEVRGKIVVMRRYETSTELNVDWPDQGGSALASPAWTQTTLSNGLTVQVQDRYEYSNENKWQSVHELLAEPLPENTLRLNYLSTKGESFIGIPQNHCKMVNGSFAKYIWNTNEAGRGVLIFDFVTEALARHVFAQNTFIG